MEQSSLIRIGEVPGKGRGVFAKCPIKKGAVIERVPVLLVPVGDLVNRFANPTLNRYFYRWDRKNVAVSLGYGSLYNHSYKPNAHYIHHRYKDVITYRALRDIAEGEEIAINYNHKPTDKKPMKFNVV